MSASYEERRLELIRKKKDIEVQLADRDRKHPDGTPLSSEEYWQWRRKAMFAIARTDRQLAELKLERSSQSKNGWAGHIPEGRPQFNTQRCEWLIRLIDAKDAELIAAGEEELSLEEIVALVDEQLRKLLAARILGKKMDEIEAPTGSEVTK